MPPNTIRLAARAAPMIYSGVSLAIRQQKQHFVGFYNFKRIDLLLKSICLPLKMIAKILKRPDC
jgi:hypothetical protein